MDSEFTGPSNFGSIVKTEKFRLGAERGLTESIGSNVSLNTVGALPKRRLAMGVERRLQGTAWSVSMDYTVKVEDLSQAAEISDLESSASIMGEMQSNING